MSVTLESAVAPEHMANPNLDPAANPDGASSNYQLAHDAAAHTDRTVTPGPEGAQTPSALPPLHIKSPLVLSDVLSSRTGHNIWLKLDALQPSGSFKIRGIGRVCQQAFLKFGPSAHIIASSGGNAGLAAATAAKGLGLKCTVYTPISTEAHVVDALRGLGAEVDQNSTVWDEADKLAREALAKESTAVYVHPFEGVDLVQGHTTLTKEIYEQLGEQGVTGGPDVICCAVGGGGMMEGILLGLSEIESDILNYRPPKIITTQDIGTDAFSQSYNLSLLDPVNNADAQVVLPAITSKATSMGSKRCSPFALKAAREYAATGSVNPAVSHRNASNSDGKRFLSTVVIEDGLSGSAAWQFMKDHEIMVEMACGAALTPAYHHERLLAPILDSIPGSTEKEKRDVVLIVCGGSKVDQETLDIYEREYGKMEDGRGEATFDGAAI